MRSRRSLPEAVPGTQFEPRVQAWHDQYCDLLGRWVETQPRCPKLSSHPTMMLTLGLPSRVAGCYFTGHHLCAYSLSYVIVTRRHYEETVAHEVCHAYTKICFPFAKWHGEFFKYLMWRVCGFSGHKTRHSYDHKTAAKVQQLLLLERQKAGAA